MLDLWNGGAIDPADIYGSGCVENGDSTFEPQELFAKHPHASIGASEPALHG
jgi:hypothetical protein